MKPEEINFIAVNKNRGWRGLAEVKLLTSITSVPSLKTVFSFSQPMWNIFINKHRIVVQDETNYYVITFADERDRLPKPTQQRSVLIKNFMDKVETINTYEKTEWTKAEGEDWNAIYTFIANKNNHTTSDWNYIGVRVTPEI